MKCIIYTGANGRCMIYGDVETDTLPMPWDSVIIRNARMILHVKTVGNLGIGAVGPNPGSDTRITGAVHETACTVNASVKCKKEAAEAIEAWPVWR